MRDTGFMIWFTLKIGNLETTGGQWIVGHMLPTFRPTISPLCIRIWVLGLTLISLLSNSTHARTRPGGRPYLLFRLQSLPLFKERWDNVSMRKWERISFPHGHGEIRGRTPTQHQFNNYFQILSGWKYWLTGVTSIVLGLFGFLGNFFAIAVLWDEFLWSSCDVTLHHFFKFLCIFGLAILPVLWRVSLSLADRRCRQFYKISKISRRRQVS